MCGIAGFLTVGTLPSGSEQTLKAMRDAIRRRGPDSAGEWFDRDAGIALGHRRLSIIDISPAGHQPMFSSSGRYIIVYNGEIYNYQALRTELEGLGMTSWRGHSDTEVLLAAIEQWGVDRALERATGMFAIALWDRRERTLTLARDRIGEKPLYYGWQGSGSGRTLVFASELSALRMHPSLDRQHDCRAVAALTTYGYIPEPLSIYRGISKLEAGTRITFSSADTNRAEKSTFWHFGKELEKTRALSPVEGREAVDLLEEALASAVASQMVSDVPLGAFLSGGVDSSTIVALMQRHSTRPIKTFNIGYDDPAYDESNEAERIATQLRTEHHKWIVTSRDAMDVIPQLPDIYSEPFADSSQIPTYLVSRFARSEVVVALSGDAGDELFGGYNRYRYTRRLWDRIALVPRPLRRLAATGLATLPAPALNRFGAVALGNRVRLLGDKVHKGAGVLGSRNIDELYGTLVAAGRAPGEDRGEFASFRRTDIDLPPGIDPVRRMMANDMLGYLPGDILAKVDRAAMANSLETRVPMLDPAVIQLAQRMPLETLFRDGEGKWPLRQVLARTLGTGYRPAAKMGFGIPLDAWLRGPLRDWGSELVNFAAQSLGDLIDGERAKRLWAEHIRGEANRQHQLWPVLILAAWSKQDDPVRPIAGVAV